MLLKREKINQIKISESGNSFTFIFAPRFFSLIKGRFLILKWILFLQTKTNSTFSII